MEPLHPYTERRPWGEFREYVKNMPVTVKTIFVKNGEELSLQKHEKRSEFWKVLKGSPSITIGGSVLHAEEGDEFTVPVGETHRITAKNGDAEILEISTGEFDEEDIVRLEDKYGRNA